jgi:hypothetical protein
LNINNQKIICGKFDDKININNKYLQNNKLIRIGSENPNTLTHKIWTPIATNGKVVLYENEIYEVRIFLNLMENNSINNLIVLTIKEKNLILDALIDFNIEIEIFELKYPIFSDIKYISNIHKNHDKLNSVLKNIKTLNIKGNSLSHQLSTEYLFRVERKLRFKNQLDSFFAFAYKGGYSEIFKLKEEREDRNIIALDFNSMYIDSMMGDFLEPKSIKYKNYREENPDINQLYHGLYRVVLKNPIDSFFQNFHPFKFVKFHKSFYFKLENNQDIELFLFKNEILYYKKFFHKIEILEGFYSKKTIKHPLKKRALEIYNKRLNAKENNNQIEASLFKYQLITMHSSTNPRRFKTLYFKTKKEMVEYISKKFMFNLPHHLTLNDKIKLIANYKYFTFQKHKKGYKLKVINFDNHDSVYSLSSQIVANSRLKMIQTIEKFLSFPSVEICYTNIDSLHISIQKSETKNFLSKYQNIISNELGHLKIESISSRGYWFDVGRYWLFTNKNVDIFKNIFFNHTCNKTPFLRNRSIKFTYKGDYFNYVKTVYTDVYKQFSYSKKIDISSDENISYTRYTYNEIKNFKVAYPKEISKSKKLKISLFNKIATV